MEARKPLIRFSLKLPTATCKYLEEYQDENCCGILLGRTDDPSAAIALAITRACLAPHPVNFVLVVYSQDHEIQLWNEALSITIPQQHYSIVVCSSSSPEHLARVFDDVPEPTRIQFVLIHIQQLMDDFPLRDVLKEHAPFSISAYDMSTLTQDYDSISAESNCHAHAPLVRLPSRKRNLLPYHNTWDSVVISLFHHSFADNPSSAFALNALSFKERLVFTNPKSTASELWSLLSMVSSVTHTHKYKPHDLVYATNVVDKVVPSIHVPDHANYEIITTFAEPASTTSSSLGAEKPRALGKRVVRPPAAKCTVPPPMPSTGVSHDALSRILLLAATSGNREMAYQPPAARVQRKDVDLTFVEFGNSIEWDDDGKLVVFKSPICTNNYSIVRIKCRGIVRGKYNYHNLHEIAREMNSIKRKRHKHTAVLAYTIAAPAPRMPYVLYDPCTGANFLDPALPLVKSIEQANAILQPDDRLIITDPFSLMMGRRILPEIGNYQVVMVAFMETIDMKAAFSCLHAFYTGQFTRDMRKIHVPISHMLAIPGPVRYNGGDVSRFHYYTDREKPFTCLKTLLHSHIHRVNVEVERFMARASSKEFASNLMTSVKYYREMISIDAAVAPVYRISRDGDSNTLVKSYEAVNYPAYTNTKKALKHTDTVRGLVVGYAAKAVKLFIDHTSKIHSALGYSDHISLFTRPNEIHPLLTPLMRGDAARKRVVPVSYQTITPEAGFCQDMDKLINAKYAMIGMRVPKKLMDHYCVVCRVGFARSFALIRHYKAPAHTQHMDPFNPVLNDCRSCVYSFSAPVRYLDHITTEEHRICAMERPCPFCHSNLIGHHIYTLHIENCPSNMVTTLPTNAGTFCFACNTQLDTPITFIDHVCPIRTPLSSSSSSSSLPTPAVTEEQRQRAINALEECHSDSETEFEACDDRDGWKEIQPSKRAREEGASGGTTLRIIPDHDYTPEKQSASRVDSLFAEKNYRILLSKEFLWGAGVFGLIPKSRSITEIDTAPLQTSQFASMDHLMSAKDVSDACTLRAIAHCMNPRLWRMYTNEKGTSGILLSIKCGSVGIVGYFGGDLGVPFDRMVDDKFNNVSKFHMDFIPLSFKEAFEFNLKRFSYHVTFDRTDPRLLAGHNKHFVIYVQPTIQLKVV